MAAHLQSDWFKLNEDESFDVQFSDAVFRAIDISLKYLKNEDAAADLFTDIVSRVVPGATNAEIRKIVRDGYLTSGVDVYVENINAIMMCAPYPNNKAKDLIRPQIIFSTVFICQSRSPSTVVHNRQLFLHVIKIFHEFSHTLTNGIMQLHEARAQGEAFLAMPAPAKQYHTPVKFGQMHAKLGDLGSEFEEEMLGGCLVPNPQRLHSPFSVPLQLRTTLDATKFPGGKNVQYVDIYDEYILSTLIALESWKAGERLPRFTVPLRLLQLPGGADAAEASPPPEKKQKSTRSASTSYENLREHMMGSASAVFHREGVAYGGELTDADQAALDKGYKI